MLGRFHLTNLGGLTDLEFSCEHSPELTSEAKMIDGRREVAETAHECSSDALCQLYAANATAARCLEASYDCRFCHARQSTRVQARARIRMA